MLAGLLAALSGGCLTAPGADTVSENMGGDTSLAIVGGDATDAFAEVAAVYWSDVFQCSAVVVEPDLLITAAHCLEAFPDEGGLEVRFGTHPRTSTDRIPVASIHIHPDFRSDASVDIGLLRLTSTAPVSPVPWNEEELSDLQVGDLVTLVGFGHSHSGDEGPPIRRQVSVSLAEVRPTSLSWADPDRGLCEGDSGGPAYLSMGSGLVVAGVLREGEPDCSGWGAATRTDPFATWLAEPDESEVPEDAFDDSEDEALPATHGCACALPGQRGAKPMSPWLALMMGIGAVFRRQRLT